MLPDFCGRVMAADTPQATGTTQPAVFTNSLGMKFVPVPGTEVLFSVWDTRVQDFRVFAEATGGVTEHFSGFEDTELRNYFGSVDLDSSGKDPWLSTYGSKMLDPLNLHTFENAETNCGVKDPWKQPGFTQGDTHPVVEVSWNSAKAFCRWLTEQERANGIISGVQYYRLPTDAEWSVAEGLSNGPGNTIPKTSVYPWGTNWPPPKAVANFDDFSTNAIAGFHDGYEYTSPVGSFEANRFGLFDMVGNVNQLCDNWD